MEYLLYIIIGLYVWEKYLEVYWYKLLNKIRWDKQKIKLANWFKIL